jgi:hypothetical protein
MTPEIALLLVQDGISTGAIYVLVGLGIVLIFLVTRVIFVPFGDVVGYSALTLAALTWSGTQADPQGGSPAGGDRLLDAAGGARPLDLGTLGGRDGQADGAREPVARDGASTLGRERSQAVAREDVVHSPGRRGLCRPHEDVLDLYAEAPDPAAAGNLL